MIPEISFKLAYSIAKLADLDTPISRMASSTGLPENDVIEFEAWARSLSICSAQNGYGTVTVTQAVALRYIGRWKLTGPEQGVVRLSGQPLIADDRAREIMDNLGPDDQLEMAEAFGAEDPGEVAQVVDSLKAREIPGELMGAALLDSLYVEDEDDEDDDFEAPEIEILDLRAWEGPPSRLIPELLEKEASEWEEAPELTFLHHILRKDTLRVLMDTGEFFATLDQIKEEESTGFGEDARWPSPGPIYIELTEPSPALPDEYRDAVHGYILSEDTGDGTRMVMFPSTTKDRATATSVMLNTRTGAVTGLFGEETLWDMAIDFATMLIAFLTDENYEFVEMPLNRTARRRLQRSGAPNPWHVARRRSGH